MTNILDDTAPEVRKEMYRLLSTLSPAERFSRMLNLCTFGRQMMLADIKQKHPDATDSEIRRMFALRLWGPEFVEKYLNEDCGGSGGQKHSS